MKVYIIKEEADLPLRIAKFLIAHGIVTTEKPEVKEQQVKPTSKPRAVTKKKQATK